MAPSYISKGNVEGNGCEIEEGAIEAKHGNRSVPKVDSFYIKPIWVIGQNADTFRFLIQWLVVSLMNIRLMILQLGSGGGASFKNPSGDKIVDSKKLHEANCNAIAKICTEADKKGWTTGDLMAIISRESFQHINESVEDCARRILYFHS